MDDLVEWKNSRNRKPLILRGARQTGKTWILQEFGTNSFSDMIYIHLEENAAMTALFSGSLDPQRLLEGLSAYAGKAIKPDSLVILDEVQAVPRALTALKYFYEELPEYHIAVAGSLLGVTLQSGASFPVGKVNFLDLYPMTFREFLLAGGHDSLVQLIQDNNFDMLEVFSEQLVDLLKQYYYVGGMPEAVLEFMATKDFSKVRSIQQSILDGYEGDFSKHAPKVYAEKSRRIWDSMPAQLAKENKKFIYGVVQKGGRGRDYSTALQFLKDSGLIYIVPRVSKPGIPLVAYRDNTAFRAFLVDVGLLGAMADLSERSIVEGNLLLREFKGTFTEQFVCQELIAECGYQLYYWSSEKSSGEIDFMFQSEEVVYPVEVKAAENLKSKSLAAFSKKYDLRTSIRLSLSGYRDQGWMRNIPLYATGGIRNLLKN